MISFAKKYITRKQKLCKLSQNAKLNVCLSKPLFFCTLLRKQDTRQTIKCKNKHAQVGLADRDRYSICDSSLSCISVVNSKF